MAQAFAATVRAEKFVDGTLPFPWLAEDSRLRPPELFEAKRDATPGLERGGGHPLTQQLTNIGFQLSPNGSLGQPRDRLQTGGLVSA